MAKRRLGTTTMVTLIAGLITAGAGLTADSERPAAAREAQADDHARHEMLALGWVPAQPNRDVVAGVEVLVATGGFELTLGNGMVSGTAPTPEARATASRVVHEELARLPPSFLAKAELRRVVLTGELREDKQPIPSLPNYNRTLLLDADASEGYLRRLIHHEIFHFVDLADDGTVLRDESWSALNPADFRYGFGGRAMRDGAAASSHGAAPGFVTRYAQSGLEEDKAEVFAMLLVAPTALRERMADDAVILEKAERIRALVTAFAPAMAPLLRR